MLVFTACQNTQINVQQGTLIQDSLKNGALAPRLTVISAGKYKMGTPEHEPMRFAFESPVHTVNIEYSFAVSQTEVTWGQYREFVNATEHATPDGMGWDNVRWDDNDMPVFNVSWHDAIAYTQWLSNQTGKAYRLLSEAEWEYAARAGTKTIFHTGNCIGHLQANFASQYKYADCPNTETYLGRPVKVANFAPNAWGLFDMHGNMFEWVQDCWHQDYHNAPADGSAWPDTSEQGDDFDTPASACEKRVLRGGSWSGRAQDLRSGYRANNTSTFKSLFIGFRVARDL